jgi:hypothetical protein
MQWGQTWKAKALKRTKRERKAGKSWKKLEKSGKIPVSSISP